MMSKSIAEYYNLEKTAEVLSVSAAEVNRLREQSKLRGFRDGNNWKFLKEDIHNYLAETIKARSGNDHKAGESDFDLMGTSASPSSFDLLMEDAPLPGEDQLVSASRPPASDLDLASLEDEDDLALAEETRISAVAVPILQKAKPVADSGFDLTDDDSDALTLAPAQEVHAVTLDNESVLDAGSSSPQLGLAGESGFDILVADEDADILQEVREGTEPVTAGGTEFELEPSPKMPDSDDSESSSQVIAIDHVFSSDDQMPDPFEQGGFDAPDFAGFDSGIQSSASVPATNDSFGGFPPPDTFTAPSFSATAKKAVQQEEEYSTGTLVALTSALVVMLLPGLMLVDTVVHIWSWGDPFILNSFLMQTISGWFGL
jgi:hypothetical protein